jgi:hypothetical protein
MPNKDQKGIYGNFEAMDKEPLIDDFGREKFCSAKTICSICLGFLLIGSKSPR